MIIGAIRDGDDWAFWALKRLRAEESRCGETPLKQLALPEAWGVQIYLKDESAHVTKSLKHRLARNLFLDAIASGRLLKGGTVVDSSSGSTAVAEAYFARLLGLSYIAVVPRNTSPQKLAAIEHYGGHCHLVASSEVAEEAALALVESHSGGVYLDQFEHASRVSDWQSNGSLPGVMLSQLRFEKNPIPFASVSGLGTGGTASTLGRYWRSRGLSTLNVAVDPEGSVLCDYWRTGDVTLTAPGSKIEGIGRPGVVRSFMPETVHRVVTIDNEASIAGMDWLDHAQGIKAGPSTGSNVWVALVIAREMRTSGLQGSIVSLICDDGERYVDTFYDAAWREAQGFPAAANECILDRVA